jgi:flagellar motor switch protein FliM
MSDQILSQEEIDALLTAMDKGEVDLEEESPAEKEVVIEKYDLTSQSAMLRDQFFALEEVYDKFISIFQNTISSSLQKGVEIEMTSTEMVKFGEFVQAFSNPTGFNIFSMEPLIGSAMLAIDAPLVLSVIDCMFGGDGKPYGRMREFTTIEKNMMRKFSRDILESMEKAWELVYSVKIRLKKIETKPEFVHMVAPNDLVIVVVYQLNAEEFSGSFHFCIPYLMLEPIKDKLSSRYLREKDMELAWNTQLQNHLKKTYVNLSAILGQTENSVRELLSLKVDDVIRLPRGTQGHGFRNGGRGSQVFWLPRRHQGGSRCRNCGSHHGRKGERRV